MVSRTSAASFLRLALIAVAVVMTVGCSIAAANRRLLHGQLTSEMQALKLLRAQLSSGDYQPDSNDVYVFLSSGLINQILAGAHGVTLSIPGRPDAAIEIRKLHYRPLDGSAALEVAAQARSSRVRTTLDVNVFARLMVAPNPAGGLQIVAQIEDVAPVFSWRCIKLPVLGMARALAKVAAAEWAHHNLSFPVPTESLVKLGSVGSVERHESMLGEAQVAFTVRRPDLMRELRLSHRSPLFLRDGVHLFAKLDLVPR